MKIKLLVPLSGADGSFNKGDIIEVSNGEAERFVAKEYAEYVSTPPKKTKSK